MITRMRHKYFRRHVYLRLVMLGIVALSGCVHLPDGPIFKKIDNIPPNTGLVYLYRPSRLLGNPLWGYVKANDEIVVSLINGGYYPYWAKPGKTKFDMGGGTVTVEVQAGRTYYVRATFKIKQMTIGFLLELVTPDIGEEEIKSCKSMSTLMLPALP